MFPGSQLFRLKDTHGLPFEMALQLVVDRGLTVEWCSLVDEARSQKWWDFQTYDLVKQALADIGMSRPEQHQILIRLQAYIMETLHGPH